jgi:hypothetical protein
MNSSHAKALRGFARGLHWLLAFRLGVQFATVWFFVWGVVVLALRVFRLQSILFLEIGLLGVIPLAAAAAWRARRQMAAFTHLRANYDRLNHCGGLIMAEEAGDMGAWAAELPAASAPRLRWRHGRALFQLAVAGAFSATALLLPDRLTHFAGHRPLEIGQAVGQLQAEIKTLRQENIIDQKKAEAEQAQLAQLQNDSLGYDPDKTWEALDHIKQADADKARQAAEEALNKTDALAQAGTMANGMSQAAEAGMNETTAALAAHDLASMLSAARLEAGLLDAKIPPELLNSLNGLNQEQLSNLMRVMEFKKNALGRTMTNLANLRLIDPAKLSQCRNAGQCKNPAALAAYLASCTNGCSQAQCLSLCRGGLSRGGGAAPMTWTDGASEKDLKFTEHALPAATQLSDAQLIGVSKTAPQLNQGEIAESHGALDQTAGSGGAAQLQRILPEQRQAVRQFFKRDN